MSYREIIDVIEYMKKSPIQILKVMPTIEGAGVRLWRGFAQRQVPRFDPFLLFDDMSSSDPEDYLPGFPMHPHRGIETVTYVLDGAVRHRDSMGNEGVIEDGDVQWMTAGSGIIHEEMPESASGLRGFQLWVNLPEAKKMTTPDYREVDRKDIPEVTDGGASIRIIAGEARGAQGGVSGLSAKTVYLDVALESGASFTFPIPEGYTTFIYILDGALGERGGGVHVKEGDIVLYSREGDGIEIRAGSSGARFLLIAGKPLGEAIAWRGPIVMNRDEEIAHAFRELAEGNFIKR